MGSGKDVIEIILPIEFSEEDEVAKWEKYIEKQREENELIAQIVKLTVKEIQSGNTLILNEALVKVTAKNPKILRMIKNIKTEQIKQKIVKLGAGGILDILVNNKIESNTDLSYSEAFNEVQIEYPEIALEYANEIRKS